jgi:beta-lactamase regulating signal transducer with metallopeptidase domain
MIAVLTNHVWQSTLFAVAAWLVTLALRRNRAQVRYCVWLAASLKFLLPFSLLVSLGDRIEWRTAAPEPQFAIAIERSSQPFTPSAPAFTGTPKNAEVLPAALVAVWGCGFVAVVFLFGRRWTRMNADAKCARAVGIEAPIPVKCSRGLVEPGVFGLLRPVLLLPEGIVERLTPAQLDAILSHEMCHVRRRDNVWAAVHMIVEAAFWFHPFAWWIGA